MSAVQVVGRVGSCVAALVIFVTACGSGGPPDQGSESSPPAPVGTASPTAEVTTVPPVEGTGPEQPQQGETRGPAIPVASLPIGGSSVTPPVGEPVCASVSYLAPLPPPGVTVSVTAARIEPPLEPPLFTVSGSGCGDRPLCLDRSFVFTADVTGCSVAVAATGVVSEEGAALVLDGVVHCPAGQDALCAQVVHDDRHGEIELVAPTPGEQPAPDTSSPGSTS